jgi:hypothetical protein
MFLQMIQENKEMKKIKEIILTDKTIDFTFLNNKAIHNLYMNGQIHMVNLLFSKKEVRTNLIKSHNSLYKILIDDEFINNALENNINKVKKFLIRKKIKTKTIQSALYASIQYGNLEIVKLLLNDERVEANHKNNRNLIVAVDNGHIDIVSLLLNDKSVDPSDQDNEATITATTKGNIEILKLLLTDKRVLIEDDYNEAMTKPAQFGHFDIIELLLKEKRIKPEKNKNWAIRTAYNNNEFKIADYLFSYKDVQKSLINDSPNVYEALFNRSVENKINKF